MATARNRQEERDSRNLDAPLDQKDQINLTNSGIDEKRAIIDVSTEARVSITLTEATPASWTTGEVTLKRSIDRINWYDLDTTQTADAPREFWDLNVEDANYIAIDVTTVASGSTRVLWNAKTYSPQAGGEVSTDPNDPIHVVDAVEGTPGVVKFGFRGGVGTTNSTVWTGPSAVYTGFITAPEQVNLVSADVNDTAAGTGCRSLEVVGLDGNLDLQEITYALNGTTPVLTAESWWRIYRMRCIDNGTYNGRNVGALTATGATSTQILAQMDADRGQTEMAIFTIPRNFTGHIKSLKFNVEGNKAADMRLVVHPKIDIVSAPMSSSRVAVQIPQLIGSAGDEFRVDLFETGPADVYVEGQTLTGTADVAGIFQVALRAI